MQKRIIEGVELQLISRNVFADLGLPDAEQHRLGYDIDSEVRPASEPVGHWTLAIA
jgi:hypothetical protein